MNDFFTFILRLDSHVGRGRIIPRLVAQLARHLVSSPSSEKQNPLKFLLLIIQLDEFGGLRERVQSLSTHPAYRKPSLLP